jgi:type II secretory pathway pseudopilin PulG
MKKKRTSQAGQTIIEVLIATGVVALVMTAVAAGLTLSVKNSSQSKYRTLATKMASESNELFRRERDRLGWESFYEVLQADGALTTYCIDESLPVTTQDFVDLAVGSCGGGFPLAGTSFERETTIELVNPDLVRVETDVTWIDGTQQRSVVLTQELQNWR